jgi:hypothetical protein
MTASAATRTSARRRRRGNQRLGSACPWPYPQMRFTDVVLPRCFNRPFQMNLDEKGLPPVVRMMNRWRTGKDGSESGLSINVRRILR